MADTQYDLAVVGSGPGGYVAAIRASQLGMKAAIIEKGDMGGVCLNVGCIPSKALLNTADLLEHAREGKRIGFVADNIRLDFGALMAHKERVVKQMSGGVGGLMKKNKVDVYKGFGRVTGPNSVSVQGDGGEQTINTKNIIIATGSTPKSLPFAQIDEERILSSTGMLALKEVPKKLVVIGGGVIGVEMATAYHAFGTEITILEALPRIVSLADEEISAELTRVFTRKGIKIQTGVKIGGVDPTDGGIAVMYTDADGKEQRVEGDKLLLSVGRAPLTKDIGLEQAGVELDERGFIKVNNMMQTNVPSIFAIGDCVPTPALAHVASAEGILAAEFMAGEHVTPINYDHVPSPYWCSPEIGHVGLTEAQARERGYDVKVGKFPFAANGNATIHMERNGFVKIVADKKYDEILGIHIIGPKATELLAEAGLALSHEATSESMAHTIHAHPTLYESIVEAAHGLIGGTINF
ncbi:MAG: dihydrolipoyl dehydrogenase [Chloroflexi bacterium]|nr:dihydrolipoyl dehydrogenase [Chloroflexota bacterium]